MTSANYAETMPSLGKLRHLRQSSLLELGVSRAAFVAEELGSLSRPLGTGKVRRNL
jgi:hypothetical protein